MAARQSIIRHAPPRPELEKLLDEARKKGVTDAQLQVQRASFAYGNAPGGSTAITKESAKKAAQSNRLGLKGAA